MAEDPLSLVKDCVGSLHGSQNYTALFHSILQPINATLAPKPTTVIRLTVTAALCNSLGSFHGGAIATVFDECTTTPIALIRRNGFWMLFGVSRTLNVAYFEGVTEGEEVEVESQIVKIGKRLGKVVILPFADRAR